MSRTTALALKIILGILLLITTAFAVYYGVCYYSDSNKLAALLRDANEYMEAGDYENAVSVYELALDYEPENEDIRCVISNAYVMLGDSYGGNEGAEQYANALMYNAANRNAYWGIADYYEEKGYSDELIDVLDKGYENSGDENMLLKSDYLKSERDRQAAIEEQQRIEEEEARALEEKYNELLKTLYDCFEAGNPDDIKELLRQDTYISLSDEVVGEKSYYYGEKDDAGLRSGMGLGVYSDGFYYFGEYRDDCRNGHGMWIRAAYSESSAIGSFIYDGEFIDDCPNGEGVATSSYYQSKVSAGGMTKQVVSGNYINGLEDGEMTLNGTLKSGGSVKYKYRCNEGVAKKSSDADSGVKGQYIIAEDKDYKLTSDGSLRGVDGFIPE